jgi:hypothetical protein
LRAFRGSGCEVPSCAIRNLRNQRTLATAEPYSDTPKDAPRPCAPLRGASRSCRSRRRTPRVSSSIDIGIFTIVIARGRSPRQGVAEGAPERVLLFGSYFSRAASSNDELPGGATSWWLRTLCTGWAGGYGTSQCGRPRPLTRRSSVFQLIAENTIYPSSCRIP